MKLIYKNTINQNAMKESQMDKFFKSKLDRYDSGAPDDLWASINAKREKPRRVVPLFVWLSGVALTLMLVALLSKYGGQTDIQIKEQSIAKIGQETIIEEEVVDSEVVTNDVDLIKEEKIITKEQPTQKQKITITEIKNEAIPESAIFVEKKEIVKEEISTGTTQNNELVSKPKVTAVAKLPNLKTALLSTENNYNPKGCYTFSGGNQALLDALYFDAFGGLGYAFRRLENIGDSDNEFYLNARDSTEREWYSFGAGLRANLRYKSGLTLRVGLQYSQINEIFEISDGNATRTTIIEIKDADGNVIDTQMVTEQGELFKKTFNRLRFVDVPVMVGYEWTKQKLTFSANAGAAFNIQFSQKGDFLSDQLEAVSFSSNNPDRFDFFRTRTNVSFIGSLGMTYQLKENLDFLVEPQIRYYPTSVGRHTISQKYTDVGLFAGLRYYLVSKKQN